MSLRPARQETNPKKRSAKRASSGPTPQPPAIASDAPSAEAGSPADDKVQEGGVLPLVRPTFVRRDLTTPDGSIRPGWEMWIGDHCFGRADNKELLLASFERLQSPPSSFHWREVRNRMPLHGRPKSAKPESPQDKPAASAPDSSNPAPAWDKKKEPVVEEPDGFQEISPETPV